jgi:membrane fusion protein, copper/silver efflux system
MPDTATMPPSFPRANEPESEGGLRAPPGLGPWGKAWWWFHFLILVKLARLRFIGILLAIGLVIVYWDTLVAYYDQWTRPPSQEAAAASDIEYFCPMHPTVVRDSPREKCPICFMPLSRRKKGGSRLEALPPGIVNRLQLSPYRVVLAGIQTWEVAYVPLAKEIATVGLVEFNEREMKHVAARVKGRIDTLYANETGQMVHEGEELALLYSPDLNVTVQNLVDAKANNNSALLRIARERLDLWGISKDQIDTILKTGKANTHLKIRSPIEGHVLRKYVKEGQYVDEGSPLYDVVDLDTVWVQAQVYEEDMPFLPTYHRALKDAKEKKAALSVTATTRAFPGQVFTGGLTFVYPHLDQDTRTVMARFELENPGHKLRPGTTANVKLQIPPRNLEVLSSSLAATWWKQTALDGLRQTMSPAGLPQPAAGLVSLIEAAASRATLATGLVLAVPDTAVIDTGDQKIVYRERAGGEYEGVKVELGPRMVGPEGVQYYPILQGLDPGDLIVTAGSFLVDAETRLNPAAGSIYIGGSGGHAQTGVSTVKPSTPTNVDAKAKAGLGKLKDPDRQLAEAQAVCPVTAEPLGSMGVPFKSMVMGQPVFFCCESCAEGALANAAKTLAKVHELLARAKARAK